MYDRILVPLDGSSLAEAALDVARLITSRLAYLLRVEAEAPQVDHYISSSGHETHKRIVFREGDEYLRRVAATLRAEGRYVEVLQSWGDPADRIVEAAADVDVIVMATSGRGAAGRVLHGSVADRVAREASVPVLLVPGGYRPAHPTITRILVPLDGSDLAERALAEAEKLANVLDAPIHLVRAVGADDVLATVHGDVAATSADPSRQDDAYERARLETERQAVEYLEDRAKGPLDSGLTTEIELLKGTPAFVLLWMIQPDDVVVMTTHGLGGYRRWMIGSVAEKLVREAAGPVLLVRDGAGSARDSTAQRSSGGDVT